MRTTDNLSSITYLQYKHLIDDLLKFSYVFSVSSSVTVFGAICEFRHFAIIKI